MGPAVCLGPKFVDCEVPCVLAEALVLVDDIDPVSVGEAEVSDAGVVVVCVLVWTGPPPPVVEAPPPVAVEHDTVPGTLTPLAVQSCWAKLMAEDWSASLQLPLPRRQQEMLPMNSLLAQMHPGSRPQLPMPLLRASLAQICWGERGPC
jgi:hypothetical protein